MANLNTYVHAVERDEHGVVTGRDQQFGPDDKLPAWAIQAIDNPDVWDGEAPVRKPRPAPQAAAAATVGGVPNAEFVEQLRARIAELEAAAAKDGGPAAAPLEGAEQPAGAGEEGPQNTKPPARSGAGSDREAWAAYAAQHQVELPADAKRDQIIEVLDAAGVPTK